MSTDDLTIDQVVETYIKIRAKKEKIESSVKEQTAALVTKMNKLEAWIQIKADELGVTSFKTPHGTAYLSTKDFAQVADWDALLGFIQTEGAYDLLVRNVNKTAVRGYIDKISTVPPGVNYGTKLEVNVRKPSTKPE